MDPYWMAVASIDEAIRNIVCVGGDPAKTAILDNFCWGNCEDPQVMGSLVRACQACYDAAIAYGTPFISGKDSLNNEFALDPADAGRLAGRMPLHNNRVRIPETLLISALGVIADVRKCVTMDAKPAIGEASRFFYVGLRARDWSEADIGDAAGLHTAIAGLIARGSVLAAHDCGQDGWMTALAEMAFAGECGVEVTAAASAAFEPFAPIPSGYVVQVPPNDVSAVQKLAEQRGVTVFELGRTCADRAIRWQGERIELNTLSEAWRSTLRW
jgi:phosphoribosylformylglycinamidine synthase subunit PurSL